MYSDDDGNPIDRDHEKLEERIYALETQFDRLIKWVHELERSVEQIQNGVKYDKDSTN